MASISSTVFTTRLFISYDPTKAQFTTFMNWQIRGELQSLRFA
nr:MULTISPECIES: hypothetical protein [Sphingomonas]